MTELSGKKFFLLDMDGTLYLDDRLFQGSSEFLSFVKSTGGKYAFLTNNSSKGCEAYIDKLARLGIASAPEDFFTSVDASILYIRDNLPGKKLYAFGTASFRGHLTKAGINATDQLSDDIDALICAYDTELTFKKLEDACILLKRGVPFIATNPDWVCPTWYGGAPDCGSVCEMLFRATGRRPKVIGKPKPEMALLALERFGFLKKDALLIGDRLYTDIACGLNAGIDSALVLSGESTLKDVKNGAIKPTYIFDSIAEILNTIKEK